MSEDTSKDASKPLTFAFSSLKKTEKVTLVKPNVSLDDDAKPNDEDRDFVLSIDGEGIKSTKPVVKKVPLVIPLIQSNNWRNKKVSNSDDTKQEPPVAMTETKDKKPKLESIDKQDSRESQLEDGEIKNIDDLAKKELQDEAAEAADMLRSGGKSSNRVIPIFMENRVPEGFEEDGNFNVSARAENPTMEDYERVPIEEFGMAMLRGMGFKEDDAKKVAPVDVKIRPKGLGLGAELPPLPGKTSHKSSSNSSSKEALELKINAHVYVTAGKQRGFYGTVQAFDEDMIQADVHLVLPNITASIPVALLAVVSRDEFKKESKVLNKSSYDDYKEKKSRTEERSHRESDHYSDHHRRDNRDHQKERHDNGHSTHDRMREKPHKSSKKSRDRSHHREDDVLHQDKDRHHDRHREKHYDDHREKDYHQPRVYGRRQEGTPRSREDHFDRRQVSIPVSSSTASREYWLFEGLRVKIIDKDFKNGRFFKNNVVIVDVSAPGMCSAMTADCKRLEDLSQRCLETIIPKEKGSKVMVVKGVHKKEIGIILDRDKDKEVAFVELCETKEVVKLPYDSICDFTDEDHFD